MEREADVQEVARRLKALNISVTDASVYPEYAPDYVAVYLSDPDGLRLEITNYRDERRQRHDNWDKLDT